MTALPRPAPDEHDPYYNGYVAAAATQDVLALLDEQRALITGLGDVPEARGNHAYQPGKWTVKEVLGHLADAERILAYRGLRIARGDTTPLAGFDENAYVPAGDFGRRAVRDVAAELLAARDATLALFRSMTPAQGARRGTANASPCSARAIPWIIAGHFAHHVGVLEARYGVSM